LLFTLQFLNAFAANFEDSDMLWDGAAPELAILDDILVDVVDTAVAAMPEVRY
jgi:hypothetical protein